MSNHLRADVEFIPWAS